MRMRAADDLGSRLNIAALLLVLIIVPLASGTEMHVILPRAGVAVAMVAMFVFNVRFKSPGVVMRLFLWLGLIWFLYGGIGLLWAPSLATGSKQLIAIFIGIASSVVIATLIPSSDMAVNWARKAWIVAFLITIPIAVHEIRTDQHRPSSVVEHVESGGAQSVAGKFAAVTFGNRNNYASFICMVFPAVLIEAISSRKAVLVLVYFGIAATALVLVAIDASRLGIVTLVLQLMVVWWLAGKNKTFLFRVLAISLLIAGYLAVAASQYTQIKLESTVSGDDQSLAQRFEYSLRGLQLAADSGGMGVGAGGYNQDAANGLLESAHDVWVEIAADYGVIIFTGMVFVLLLGLRRLHKAVFAARRLHHQFHPDALYGFLLAISLPGIGVMNSSCITSAQFWAMIGMVVGLASIVEIPSSSFAYRVPVGSFQEESY